MRERIAAAEVQHDYALRLGVLFVIAEVRFDEQFLADEPGRRVAPLADVARRAQVPNRRRNGRGVGGNQLGRDAPDGTQGYLNQLLGAVYLGLEVRRCTGADV